MTAKKKVLDKVETSSVPASEVEVQELLPVGEILKSARLKRKGTLPRIAAALKIRQVYLKALEEENTSELPELVFTLGFLRSYALYLGLDAQALVERYQEEFKQSLLWGGAYINVLSMFVEIVPSGTTLALKENTNSRNLNLAPKESEKVSSQLRKMVDEGGENFEFPTLNAQESVSSVIQNSQPGSLVEEKSGSVSQASVATLKAMERTWIALVREEDGRVLENKILSKGDSIRTDLDRGLVLSVGNAGGVFFEIQGRKTPPLGKNGEVIRRIPLTSEGIWGVAKPSEN
ncbi:hypothetical protein AWC38_SpisGene25080 [Stylophora pistillata]|uniref:Cytoskeleton protein RodZ-like C-terminal domain-containing protein n=1 Tax=Stylophora pistillata TaxID=50429 RepID=A0A2B4R4I2_STYPI|nr:hypothetical protein AWC38_SpisGene25080 [Stylophora pistillata]